MEIKQWPLSASGAEPFWGAEHKPSWISTGLNLSSGQSCVLAQQNPSGAQSASGSAGLALVWGKLFKPQLGMGLRAAAAQAWGEPNGAIGTERNFEQLLPESEHLKKVWKHLTWSICYHKGSGIPCVISHDLHSLSKVFLTGKKKAPHIGILSQMPEWNISFWLCCLVSFLSLEGIAPGDRAWPQQEHTQTMQDRADTVPKGRAGSAHPGLANLGPFCCLQCYDLPVWKNNCLLRMIKDTGVTQTDTHVSAQGEENGSRASQLHFWWHSKSAEWFYGREFTWRAESGKDPLYTNQRFTFVKMQLKR